MSDCRVLFVLFCGLFVSCHSPNEPDQADSPIVTIVLNRANLSIGDTLQLTLHTLNAALSEGSLNFHDGEIISFSHLTRMIDTTITHVYSTSGTYSIAATFSDGKVTHNTTKHVEVRGRYFALTFSHGMKWRFSYDYLRNDALVGSYVTQHGIHEWKIIGSVLTNQDTTYTIQQIRNDTRHTTGEGYPSRIDTTTTICDTTFFNITASYSKVQWTWPMNSPLDGTVTIDVIPNHTYINQYPIVIRYPTAYDANGPFSYSYYWHPRNFYEISETLTLIDFTKP